MIAYLVPRQTIYRQVLHRHRSSFFYDMASFGSHGLAAAATQERQQEAPVAPGLQVPGRDKGSRTRSAMQDFSAFPLYLSSAMWDAVEDQKIDNVVIVKQITQMLARDFKLRCPSESTSATLTSLLILREPEAAARQKLIDNGYAFLTSVKAQISQILLPFKQTKVEAAHYMERLPVDSKELPESLPIRTHLELVKPRMSVSELLMTAQAFNWREAKGKKINYRCCRAWCSWVR